MQVLRLGEKSAGLALLRHLRLRIESRAYATLNTVGVLCPKWPWKRATLDPPWSHESVDCALTIPHMRSKRCTPIAEARSLVLEHLEREYRDSLHIYTDGSVDAKSGVCGAAFFIPSLNISWAARVTPLVSSTASECVAIEAALRQLSSFERQKVTIFSDSKSALHLLQRGIPVEKTCQRSLLLLKRLKHEGFTVQF